MQSLKSRFIIFLIKKRHLLKFKLKPEIVDENFDVAKFRSDLDRMSDKLNRVPEDIEIKKVTIHSVRTTRIAGGLHNPIRVC